MKKKGLIAMLLACSMMFGAASVTACNLGSSEEGGEHPGEETVAVDGVSLNRETVDLKVGESVTLTPTISPSGATNKNVSWSSDDPSVASVSGGVVTAHSEGQATITVTTAEGSFTADCIINVTEDVTTVSVEGVSLDLTSKKLKVGETVSLTPTVTPSDAENKNVSWSSSDPAVASVSGGVVTAHKAGTATITVTTADGNKTAQCAITVEENTIAVTGVTLSPTLATLAIGETASLTPTITPSDATNKNVSWSSNNSAVASVSGGVVTAHSAGTARITVTTADGNKTAYCDVTVSQPIPATVKVTGVTVNPTTATLEVNATKQLTCTVTPLDATNKEVTWTSGNTSVATVGNDGLVTAKAAGSAKITVKTADGNYTAECTITVEENAPQPVVNEKITYSYAGNECAAFEWGESNVAGAKVEYKLKSASSYTELSGNDKTYLVRQKNATTARVDFVGLKGGAAYDFKITTSAKEVLTAENVTIHAYDRSGYAHFKKSDGVGAYNNDGTPKSNAVIVYVNEDNKNTVTANGKTGLVSILKNASASKPLIVRVVGTVGSATWNELKYNGGKAFSDENLVVGLNSTGKLPTDSTKLTQKYLSEKGYNTLNYTPNDPFYTARTPDANGATCTVLSGIEESSKATYKSGEYDSCWNNVSLSGLENVTVEGIGEDARIFQWGFTWNSCKSIEVRNIKFDDYTEDACSFESGEFNNGNGYYWVHNNTFEQGKNYWDLCPEQDKHEGDGATDFKRVRNITIAYNHYYKNHKTGLIGSGDDVLTANVTFHHNYYETNSSRMPLGRQANMHMYNNYYYGSTGTNMSLRGNAFALIENCYFENANNPILLESGSVAKVLGSVFTGKTPASNDNLHIDTNDSTLKRETKVANNNTVVGSGKYFDVDSSLFYYDSTNKRSNVSVMFTAQETKTYVPQLAGVQKRGGDVTLGGSSSGGGTGTETPDPNPGGETGAAISTTKPAGTISATISDFSDASGKTSATVSAGNLSSYISNISFARVTSDNKTISLTSGRLKFESGVSMTVTAKSSDVYLVLNMSDRSESMSVTEGSGEAVNVDLSTNKTIYIKLTQGSTYVITRVSGNNDLVSIGVLLPN